MTDACARRRSIFFLCALKMQNADTTKMVSIIDTIPHDAEAPLAFILHSVSLPLSNALRRYILAEVPAFAVDECEFIESSTCIPDDAIADRISQMPLGFSVDCASSMRQFLDCPCEHGCSDCTIQLELDVTADPHSIRRVWSEDMHVVTDTAFSIRPPMGNNRIEITRLNPGERLHVICNARVGTGKMHARWQTVGAVAWHPVATVEIDPIAHARLTGIQRKQIVQSCPKQVFNLKQDTIVVEQAIECTFCGECLHAVERMSSEHTDTLITIGRRGSSGDAIQKLHDFRFIIEPTGMLPAIDCVDCALRILVQNIDSALACAHALQH